MKNEEVQDFIEQLKKQLKLWQSELLVCLKRVRDREAKTDIDKEAMAPADQTQESPPLLKETWDFVIGDNKVRFRNPKPFQADQGVIIKIGNSWITVQTKLGSKILCAPKYLI